MWKFLLSFLSGPLKDISNDIKEAYQSKLAAENDKERTASQERINYLEAREAVILRAMSDRFERWVRIGFAIPFILYIWKLIIWDKLLEWGATDGLSTDLWSIFYIVLAGYFVDVAVKRFKS